MEQEDTGRTRQDNGTPQKEPANIGADIEPEEPMIGGTTIEDDDSDTLAEKRTASRLLVIEYDGDGRYHEHLFSRTVPDNASPVYIDPVGRKFNESLLTCRSKVCPIPDDAKLCRWVLRDGTVITTTHEFPQSDYVHLRTFDERYMFVPMSNIAYVMEDFPDDAHDR